MPSRTPLIQTKNGNKLDFQEWRKSLNFTAPPKTAEQIAADVAAHITIEDIRDNRDPKLLGNELIRLRETQFHKGTYTCAEAADSL